MMVLNGVQALLQMSSPFIIKPLIQYIKTGQNAWEGKVEFWQTSHLPIVAWLTPETQYGLTLALTLVAT